MRHSCSGNVIVFGISDRAIRVDLASAVFICFPGAIVGEKS
jgi:hypothetical protein